MHLTFREYFIPSICLCYIVSFSLSYLFPSVRSGYSFINFCTYSFKSCKWNVIWVYPLLRIKCCFLLTVSLGQIFSFFQVQLLKNVVILVRTVLFYPLSWKIAHLNLAETMRYLPESLLNCNLVSLSWDCWKLS